MSQITLVVPAYNEELNIKPFFERCMEVEKLGRHGFSFLFIDDGSSDATYDRIEELCRDNPDREIKGIRFSRNFGKESALLAGMESYRDMRVSAGDFDKNDNYLVFIDADLQQDPEHVIKMADYLDNNQDYDVVCCYQINRKESGFIKFAKRRFYRIIDKTTDTKFVEDASDFRMMRNTVVDAVIKVPEYNRFSKGIFSWIGFKTHYIPYEVKERAFGETKWTFRKLLKYGVDGIVGFSTAPLRAATWLGTIVSLLALIYLVFNVVVTLVRGVDVPGYATIVCLVLLLGGVQMVLLGIIGEYISKMYIETKRRPIYIVKESTDNAASKEDVDKENEK